MNNQAAQTMPEPEDWQKIHVLMAVMEFRPLTDVERKEMHEALVSIREAALSQTAGVPSWIVNDLGELGVMVNGVAYFLYKGDNIVYEDAKHDDGSPMLYRMVGKREFGEVCHPRHWEESGWAAARRYTQELIYTPGLSFGKPKDGDWRPLPAKGAAPAASGGEVKPEPSPKQCRERLMREGKPYPKSGCAVCKTGGMTGCPYEKAVHAPQPPAAASVSGVHPDALPDGTLSKSTAKRVTALAAASVSERARELLAAEYDGIGMHGVANDMRHNKLAVIDRAILRAIEQALTQQRGESIATPSNTGGEMERCEKCGRDAVHYLVMDNLPQPGRRMPFCSGCTMEHEYTAQEVNDHEMRNFGGAYGLVAFHYEPLDTTPHPSADAVRELVRKWREDAEIADRNTEGNSYASCADELESLLSGGSHA